MKRLLTTFLAWTFLSTGTFAQIGPLPVGPFAPNACSPNIGTPSKVATGGGSTSASTTFTTTASIVAGNLVVLIFSASSNANTITAVSDGTNSYTKLFRSVADSNQDIEYWYKANASAASSSATVTLTISSATGKYAALMYQASGIALSSAGDVSNSNSGGGTSNTGTSTGTLAVPDELIFGNISVFNGGGNLNTFGNLNSFTNLDSRSDGTNTANLATFYRIVTGTSSVSFAPTWAQAASPTSSLVAVGTFKGPC